MRDIDFPFSGPPLQKFEHQGLFTEVTGTITLLYASSEHVTSRLHFAIVNVPKPTLTIITIPQRAVIMCSL
ncbi:Uncharacterised protein [Corynebacterium diphtheriae]|nr:Uncharacterised protein [Corynebacterium diphtheriae]